MKLSTKTRFATRALLDLAVTSKGKPVQIRTIAKRQNLSIRYLENIFTVLRAGGILLSTKGRGGGFSLAKDPLKITILDIVELVDGKISLVHCIDSPTSCDRSLNCVPRDVWKNLNSNLKKTLSATTLNDLIKNHKNKVKNTDNIMYHI